MNILMLSNELLQIIFRQLDQCDLFAGVVSTCKRFSDVVMNFMAPVSIRITPAFLRGMSVSDFRRAKLNILQSLEANSSRLLEFHDEESRILSNETIEAYCKNVETVAIDNFEHPRMLENFLKNCTSLKRLRVRCPLAIHEYRRIKESRAGLQLKGLSVTVDGVESFCEIDKLVSLKYLDLTETMNEKEVEKISFEHNLKKLQELEYFSINAGSGMCILARLLQPRVWQRLKILVIKSQTFVYSQSLFVVLFCRNLQVVCLHLGAYPSPGSKVLVAFLKNNVDLWCAEITNAKFSRPELFSIMKAKENIKEFVLLSTTELGDYSDLVAVTRVYGNLTINDRIDTIDEVSRLTKRGISAYTSTAKYKSLHEDLRKIFRF